MPWWINRAKHMLLAGIGRVVFWEGGSLWLALITGGNGLHLHHAVQVSLPLSGSVQFRRSPSADWVEYAGAIIAPDTPHAFHAPGRVVANILFEPESPAGRSLLARHGGSGISELTATEVSRLVGPFARAYGAEASDDELIALARNAIADLAGVDRPAGFADPRVLKAIAHIRDHLAEPLSLSAVAAAVHLSPSRMRHLFVHETGVSCKAYILWERLNVALSMGFSGTPWTEAAHAANFADSAHLSRTCRRMFGMAPTGGRIEHSAQVSSTPA